MSNHTWFIIALVIYFVAMIGIGVYGALKTKNHEDYMLGGRNLPPAVAALSAGASDMSGWLVMGLPGALYATGLVEVWLAIGLTIGAYLNWKLVAPRLRAYTEIAKNSITVPSFLSNRTRDRTNILRVAAGIIILVFFTLYVSSGMVAGGKFFESAFDGDYTTGLLLVAGVTLLYTLFGGFLGASYTDVVQGLLMFAALLIIPVLAIVSIGDLAAVAEGITTVGAENLDWFGGGLTAASVIGIISSLAWGLGYFGQPHIIVRFMALRNPGEAKTARRIGMGWMILSLLGARVTRRGGAVTVTGGPRIHGVDLDLSAVSELTPTLVGIAAFADSPSSFTGIGHIRQHETDRIAALVDNLRALGGEAHELDDGIRIVPAPLHGGTWEARHDHRIATTGALVGLRVPGVVVDDIGTTAKTMPQFPALWQQMLNG